MERLERVKHWVLARSGWQRHAALFVAGALTSNAFAPYYFWPLLLFTLPYLLLQLEQGTMRQVAWRCFFFGYGFFVMGTYWIAVSLLVDIAQFGWLFPICVFGLSAVFALYFLLMGGVFAKLRSDSRACNILLFSVLWVACEYLRSVGIFGFPWNLMGYAVMVSERLVQLASIIGTFGLSLLVVGSSFVLLHRDRRYHVGVLLVLIAAYGYGMWRMPVDVPMSETRLRLVQPNIPQEMKWTDQGKDESMRVHGVLTHMQTDAPPADLVIWSETAFPFTLSDGTGWYRQMRHFAPEGGYFITGAIRSHRGQVWNGMVAIDAEGQASAGYDKHHLVPFGEFMPFRDILPIEKITPGNTDFSRGNGVQTLTLEGLPAFSPLICYEVVFPWLAARADKRPAWLLNLTNDAWYGTTRGPYQHFAMTRMRAVEQGLPLARVANTGITALIDPYGRVMAAIPLNERGIIDRALPAPLPPTLYARLGETPIWLTIWALFLCCLYGRYRRKRG